MSEIELKPCPFCGGTKLKTGGDDKVVGVWCLTCQAAGPNHYGSREWNDRALSLEDITTYYERQIEWSRETFGPALRTKGVIDHIRKELREIEQDPHDLSEWVDVVILAMDGFWRHGGKASDLFPALLAKQKKNMARSWPDWRSMSEDHAIEHDRSKDAVLSTPPAAPVRVEQEDVMKVAGEMLAQEYDGSYPAFAELARKGHGDFTICSIRAIARALATKEQQP